MICITHHLGDSWELIREARNLASLLLQNRIPRGCQMAPVQNSGVCSDRGGGRMDRVECDGYSTR
jgi:hypothetical protein